MSNLEVVEYGKEDGKIVLVSNNFMDIDKEVRKYERIRFKEYVK